jgi:hypothetical protein
VRDSMGVAFDATRGEEVLFGGSSRTQALLGDTWTWNGTNWRIPFKARVKLSPNSGPPGTTVQVKGERFAALEDVTLTFIDSITGHTKLTHVITDGSGAFATQVTIPESATLGEQKVRAWGHDDGQARKRTFTVT